MCPELNLTIEIYRKRYAVYAGKSRLGSGFKTYAEAEKDLEDNRKMYEYWAGSAGVSIENTEPRYVNCDK